MGSDQTSSSARVWTWCRVCTGHKGFEELKSQGSGSIGKVWGKAHRSQIYMYTLHNHEPTNISTPPSTA